MSANFTFTAGSGFALLAKVRKTDQALPTYDADMSPSGDPQTFDVVVYDDKAGTTIKTLSNQAYALNSNWFDVLQTDYGWEETQPEEEFGYNFRFDNSTDVLFNVTAAVAGRTYRFVLTLRNSTEDPFIFTMEGLATT